MNIDKPYIQGMFDQIFPSDLQLNDAYASDTEAPFSDLHLSFSNCFVLSTIYDKRDDFDFDKVDFPFLDGDVPSRTTYGNKSIKVYKYQELKQSEPKSSLQNKNGK